MALYRYIFFIFNNAVFNLYCDILVMYAKLPIEPWLSLDKQGNQ